MFQNLDFLAYCDTQIEKPEIKQKVQKLIEEEKRKSIKTINEYLKEITSQDQFNQEVDDFLLKELERIQKEKENRLDFEKKYQDAVELDLDSVGNDVEKMKEKISLMKQSLENQKIKIVNTELLSEYGENLHLQFNSNLNSTKQFYANQLQKNQEEIQELNNKRMYLQLLEFKNIEKMEKQWNDLVSKNFKTRKACEKMNQEFEALNEVKKAKK
ncbi:pre-mRNA-splicing factor spf27 [Anaeramoeba ignava]|uniref:Pre-mRNA-splicing factor spf27 n=1 Tax=Anaeramoeba ignava TaxID=1746090 RepID=A0A9Q0RGI6_ANAIG|nr:pre-mRNA-splicing factor spf27 [Anaeramoeba ignava]